MHKVTTLNQFIIERQAEIPGATGEFSRLLHHIGIAAKKVHREVNKAGLVDILGKVGSINVQGEDQQKLDVYADKTFMDELNPTVREQEIYEEMELTLEMIRSIRTLCGTCLRHFVDAKTFKIALVPSADRSMDTCTVCQMRRGYDYVVMHR